MYSLAAVSDKAFHREPWGTTEHLHGGGRRQGCARSLGARASHGMVSAKTGQNCKPGSCWNTVVATEPEEFWGDQLVHSLLWEPTGLRRLVLESGRSLWWT